MKFPSIVEVSAIYGKSDPEIKHGFAEIIICSPTLSIRLTCHPDTDELVLEKTTNQNDSGVQIVTGMHRVEWMWWLTNQQGYEDGFRIQVVAEGVTRIFEFIAIASGIQVFEPTRQPNQAMQHRSVAGK